MQKGWKIENIKDVPPKKSTYYKGWKSIRWHMGINAFGVNGSTVSKGKSLTPEHDELKSNQEELFIITEGAAEFTLDNEKHKATKGSLVFVKPKVRRSAIALETPTTMIIIGAPIGKAYSPDDWA